MYVRYKSSSLAHFFPKHKMKQQRELLASWSTIHFHIFGLAMSFELMQAQDDDKFGSMQPNQQAAPI